MQCQSYFIYSMNNIEIIASIKNHAQTVFENLTTDELVAKALERNEGRITSQGALAADTGEFTGRSPKDKFLVKDAQTADAAWWGAVNQPFEEAKFDALLNKVMNHMEGKEAVQCGITHHEIATDQQSQIGANHGHSSKQVHDHLGAPVGHLAPWQQVTHEGFGHEAQEDGATKNPDQFTWFAIAAIHEATEHVQVHHHEEGRGARGVHVANEPTPRHISHDVLNGGECQIGIWFVMHHQENTGDDLNDKHQQ